MSSPYGVEPMPYGLLEAGRPAKPGEFPPLVDGQAEQWWVPSLNGVGHLGVVPYTDGITEARRPARHRPDPRSALTGEPQE